MTTNFYPYCISDTNSRSEIIIVTGLKGISNITLSDNDMHIIFKFRNDTSDVHTIKKRSVQEKHASLENLDEDDVQRVKEIIMQHQTRCHEKEHENVCKDLIIKLQSIIRRSEEVLSPNAEFLMNKETKLNVNQPNEVMTSGDISKREVQSIDKMRGVLSKGLTPIVPLDKHPANAHVHMGVPSKITDTCLLAKLLKQSYPGVHGNLINKYTCLRCLY